MTSWKVMEQRAFAGTKTVSAGVWERDAGGYGLPHNALDSRFRGNDGSAAGFVLLYLPYNGYQAGSKPASAKVDMGRAWNIRLRRRGAQPLCSFFSYPQEWGIKGG